MTTTMADHTADTPVRKSITVKATAERAFRVFTEGFDTWWPRSHHIGDAPMKRAVIEGFVGGRCYSEQTDGKDCPWGQILEWDPPRRFVMAWMINKDWKFEPDLAKCSEVEVRFTPQAAGSTLVELEHRYFNRVEGGEKMRESVGAPGGWTDLINLYAQQVEKESQ
ncbi:MAG TPA: SRPBCC family protein [Bryobacteraceae bacterium]|nr:SRPBCC family protein [Bryobacteraceae bacterium]